MWCDGCSKPGTCPLTLVSCYVEDLRCLMNSCCERQHSPAAGCRDTSKHAKASTSCSGSGSRALQPPSPQCTLGDLIFPIQCAPFPPHRYVDPLVTGRNLACKIGTRSYPYSLVWFLCSSRTSTRLMRNDTEGGRLESVGAGKGRHGIQSF